MVDAARRALLSSSSLQLSDSPDAAVVQTGQFTFIQSPAERLTFLSDRSVDLMISGMCYHVSLSPESRC